MNMKELTIVAEDSVGLLADISYLLGKSRINIEALTAGIVGNNAVIHMVVRDEKRAKEVLEKNNYSVVSSDSIVIELDDMPGALSELSKKLTNAKVNMEKIYPLAMGGKTALYAVKVDKQKKAMKVLEEYTPKEELF